MKHSLAQHRRPEAGGASRVALRAGPSDTLLALLIAGDPGAAERYAARLRVDGYTVAGAESLERGLELAATSRPDLVFVCLGTWALPALVTLVLRSNPATAGLSTVLVSDLAPEVVTREVGGLMPNEHAVSRRARQAGGGRPPLRAGSRWRPSWERFLGFRQ